jgi:hypothetical protein
MLAEHNRKVWEGIALVFCNSDRVPSESGRCINMIIRSLFKEELQEIFFRYLCYGSVFVPQ